MLRMWPAPNFGTPNAEWIANGGYYILHTDNPDFSGAVAMARTEPGILPPYQERPRTYPTELKLSFDPKTDSDLFFPLIFALGDQKSIPARLAALNNSIPELYRKTRDYYAHFFDTRLIGETPDPEFDRALRWAAIAIDQGKVRFHDEIGLVAGYYESGDSARPGYGWFFGRDSLWTSYAINGYGDFELTRQGARVPDPPPARGRKNNARIFAGRRSGGLEIHAVFLRRRRFNAAVRDGHGGLRQHQRRRWRSSAVTGTR